jgi:DNA-binding transcriptional LysR family regulator
VPAWDRAGRAVRYSVGDLHERRSGFIGKLKVNAPFGFGHLAPAVAAFQRLHPEVEIALRLFEQPMVEAADRFAVVIHIGELRASNLVARFLQDQFRPQPYWRQ